MKSNWQNRNSDIELFAWELSHLQRMLEIIQTQRNIIGSPSKGSNVSTLKICVLVEENYKIQDSKCEFLFFLGFLKKILSTF